MPRTTSSTDAAWRAPASLILIVFALFLLSGATGLVYQIAWVRGLTLTFGASHEAIGIVLAAFMGGLALGGFVFGRWADRVRRPFRLYGLLEIGIGVAAFVLPGLLRAADAIYVAAALRADGVPWWLNGLRAALAFGLLLVPTFLMGGTLPILARLLIATPADFGVRLSQLYAINTFGAVSGVLAAGFWLLPTLGVRTTELVAVAANLLVGVAAIVADRGLPDVAAANRKPGTSAVREGTPQPPAVLLEHWALRLAFFGTAVSGACALALEVMWTRGISIAVGRTTYSFAVMLAAFLIGIALGSCLHAMVPLRRVSVSLQFGVVLTAVGASSLVVSQLIPRVPRFAVHVDAWLDQPASGLRVGTTLLTSFAIMLVPCVLMGIAFPLAGQARARLRSAFGQSVGEVVGLNTLGAIVGSLTAAFVLIPWLGLQRGMLLASAVNLAYGLLVVGLSTIGQRRSLRRAALPATAAASLAALSLAFLLPDWDMRQLATFSSNTRHLEQLEDRASGAAQAVDDLDVLYYREGRGSNVSVIDDGRTRAVLIDGKSVASDSLTDMQHELLLGHLPVLLHPAPRSAAVVGLGAGITLGGVLAHSGLEEVVLVEIEPAVIDAARQFAHVNDAALDDPRLEVVFQDGRNYLRTTSRRFDVVTADPIHPWVQGASYLYTTEYYAIVADRLTDDGIMCQWLPLYELSGENVRAVIGSFADNFAYTTLWQTAYDAILIGSRSPITIDPAALGRRLRAPGVAMQLGGIGLDDPISLLAELTLDTARIAELARGVLRNRDDNLYLEFSSPLSVATPEVFDNIRMLDALRVGIDALVDDPSPLLPDGMPAAEAVDRIRRAKSGTIEAQIALQRARTSKSLEAFPRVIGQLSLILDSVPAYGRARSLLCLAWMRYGVRLLDVDRPQEGLDALQRAVRVMPDNAEANYHLATTLSELGQREAALAYFDTATRNRPRYARAFHNHGVTLMALGRFDQAREKLARAETLRPHYTEASHHLALALMRTGETTEAEERFRLALKREPGLPGLHNNYAVLLVEQARYDEALGVLDAGFRHEPDDPRLLRQTAWLLATAPEPALRDGDRAVGLARRVNGLTGERVPQVLDTLAAALAEAGRFEEAVSTAGRAVDLARAQGQASLAAAILERLEGYRQGRPHRL